MQVNQVEQKLQSKSATSNSEHTDLRSLHDAVASVPDIRQLISDCPSQDPPCKKRMSKKLYDDDDTLMMKALLPRCCTTFLQYIHPSIFRSLRGERDIIPFLPCYSASFLPFGEQFHFSGLNGSETSSAKIPPARTSFLPYFPSTLLLRGERERATAIY